MCSGDCLNIFTVPVQVKDATPPLFSVLAQVDGAPSYINYFFCIPTVRLLLLLSTVIGSTYRYA